MRKMNELEKRFQNEENGTYRNPSPVPASADCLRILAREWTCNHDYAQRICPCRSSQHSDADTQFSADSDTGAESDTDAVPDADTHSDTDACAHSYTDTDADSDRRSHSGADIPAPDHHKEPDR